MLVIKQLEVVLSKHFFVNLRFVCLNIKQDLPSSVLDEILLALKDDLFLVMPFYFVNVIEFFGS